MRRGLPWLAREILFRKPQIIAVTQLMSEKNFCLSADQIAPLAEGLGGCIATDRIMVDGCRVRFCYREEPLNDVDSGWRFMAGDESDEYMETPANHGFYDVNTVANYDRDIVPLLNSPIGSAFERETQSEVFAPVHDFFSPE